MQILKQFFGAYFHEDFLCESADWQGAVDKFLSDETRETVETALGELDELLAKELTEDELGTLALRTLGCYYYPAAEGLSWQQWLFRVHDHISASNDSGN